MMETDEKLELERRLKNVEAPGYRYSEDYYRRYFSKDPNLDQMIANKTGISVVKDDDPEQCIARGLCRVINEREFRSLTFTTKEQEYN